MSGFGPNEARIFREEQERYRVATGPQHISVAMVGPTIIAHGTAEQQERFIGPIRRGEELYCQLFSEPDAGSDLASLRTRAERDGDQWVLHGQKVWTSGAHHADRAILLARTEPDSGPPAPPAARVYGHAGITYFLIDMRQPGIEVRPIVQINGARHFNEVYPGTPGPSGRGSGKADRPSAPEPTANRGPSRHHPASVVEHRMIDTEVHDNVLVIRINRPEARNAVNGDVATGIEAAIDRLEDDESLWVGVLTGTREFFCAGADLKLIGAGGAAEMATKRGSFGGIVLRERTKPIIAAVEGPALAGGLEIVLACDLVVASRASRFGLPEVKRNLLAAAGGVVRLQRLLPRNIALELGLTGDPISAERAAALGLVNELAEPGGALEAALVLAARVTANAPLAVQATRRLMLGSAGADDEAVVKQSGEALLELMGTEDFTEGINAFIEKRTPRWKGR